MINNIFKPVFVTSMLQKSQQSAKKKFNDNGFNTDVSVLFGPVDQCDVPLSQIAAYLNSDTLACQTLACGKGMMYPFWYYLLLCFMSL